MKLLLAGILGLSSAAFAAEKFAKREPASTAKCEAAAMKTATFIDNLGWGVVSSEPLKKVNSARDGVGNETHTIKSTVSGYTYLINIQQDYRSEACVVLEVKTSL